MLQTVERVMSSNVTYIEHGQLSRLLKDTFIIGSLTQRSSKDSLSVNGPLRFTEKLWLKVLFADLLCEKKTLFVR